MRPGDTDHRSHRGGLIHLGRLFGKEEVKAATREVLMEARWVPCPGAQGWTSARCATRGFCPSVPLGAHTYDLEWWILCIPL